MICHRSHPIRPRTGQLHFSASKLETLVLSLLQRNVSMCTMQQILSEETSSPSPRSNSQVRWISIQEYNWPSSRYKAAYFKLPFLQQVISKAVRKYTYQRWTTSKILKERSPEDTAKPVQRRTISLCLQQLNQAEKDNPVTCASLPRPHAIGVHHALAVTLLVANVFLLCRRLLLSPVALQSSHSRPLWPHLGLSWKAVDPFLFSDTSPIPLSKRIGWQLGRLQNALFEEISKPSILISKMLSFPLILCRLLPTFNSLTFLSNYPQPCPRLQMITCSRSLLLMHSFLQSSQVNYPR